MNTHRCPNVEEFKQILKKHSLKATPQRLAVHEVMVNLGHASADMVTEAIAEKGTTKVTVASVYNILTNLAMLGIYDYRLSSNNKMYFDVNTYEHAHCYDTVHNHFIDIDDPELLKLVTDYISSKEIEHFEVEGIDIQITGKQK